VLFGPSTGELTLRGRHKLEQDLAVLMLTSGSSGDPKAVCLQHGQIISSLTGKSIHHGTTKEDVFLNWIGVDHVANLTEIHLHAISLAAQQVHIQGTDVLANPMWFLETIHSYKVTYTFAPNFFLAAVVRSCESFNVAGSLSSESSKTPSSNLSEDLETLGMCDHHLHIDNYSSFQAYANP
jgi:acyl-CoA synthetase (AMP-forming)/AMP-acid ligase II